MIKKSTLGFSLIEVILAISILSTLMIITTQAISRALKAKVKIQHEIDDVSSLRDTMRLIRTDLNLAFHYRDIEKEINDLVLKPKAPTGPATPTAPTAPAVARENTREDPETVFSGTEDQMNFVTMNSGRTTANSLQADFIEVGYSLKDCRNLTDTSKSSKCLYRRTQLIIDPDVTKGGTEFVILENVTEFKLRYIGEGKQDYVTTWRTDSGGDAATKGRYPEVVEVSLSIEREIDKKKKPYSMQFVIPIHFPNNPATKSSGSNLPGGAPATPTPAPAVGT
ncbi:MAG: type II secretion system protein GspJ [Pseudobdellovibrio sp.]